RFWTGTTPNCSRCSSGRNPVLSVAIPRVRAPPTMGWAQATEELDLVYIAVGAGISQRTENLVQRKENSSRVESSAAVWCRSTDRWRGAKMEAEHRYTTIVLLRPFHDAPPPRCNSDGPFVDTG